MQPNREASNRAKRGPKGNGKELPNDREAKRYLPNKYKWDRWNNVELNVLANIFQLNVRLSFDVRNTFASFWNTIESKWLTIKSKARIWRIHIVLGWYPERNNSKPQKQADHLGKKNKVNPFCMCFACTANFIQMHINYVYTDRYTAITVVKVWNAMRNLPFFQFAVPPRIHKRKCFSVFW